MTRNLFVEKLNQNLLITTYWVYMIHCENDTYYTGYTNHLAKRYKAHVEGRASKYTKSFKPVRLIQSWQFNEKSKAMKVECFIKKLSRNKKEHLVQDPAYLFSLLPLDFI